MAISIGSSLLKDVHGGLSYILLVDLSSCFVRSPHIKSAAVVRRNSAQSSEDMVCGTQYVAVGRDPTHAIKSPCRSDLYSPSIMIIMRGVFSSSSLIAGRKHGVQRPRAGLARPQRRSGTGGSDAIYFRFGTLRSFFHLRRPPELDACRQKPPKQ